MEFSEKELAKILAEHKLWVESRGKKGERANLGGADLSGVNLIGIDLSDAYLNGAKLIDADLKNTDLSRADLSDAALFRADLRSANLSDANLSDANLSRANLESVLLDRANLTGAYLGYTVLQFSSVVGANLKNALFGFTSLDSIDGALNLESVIHGAPSRFSANFLLDKTIPDSFLEGIGVPRNLVENLSSFREGSPINLNSCFISYSSANQDFSQRLFERLKSENVAVWYAPEEMKGGRTLRDQIDSAIRLHDKLLLVLSEESMESGWVETEITQARKKERESGVRSLFPISIVDDFSKIQNWSLFDSDSGRDVAKEIREFYIPNFSNWKDHNSFELEFKKLMRDLEPDSDPPD